MVTRALKVVEGHAAVNPLFQATPSLSSAHRLRHLPITKFLTPSKSRLRCTNRWGMPLASTRPKRCSADQSETRPITRAFQFVTQRVGKDGPHAAFEQNRCRVETLFEHRKFIEPIGQQVIDRHTILVAVALHFVSDARNSRVEFCIGMSELKLFL